MRSCYTSDRLLTDSILLHPPTFLHAFTCKQTLFNGPIKLDGLTLAKANSITNVSCSFYVALKGVLCQMAKKPQLLLYEQVVFGSDLSFASAKLSNTVVKSVIVLGSTAFTKATVKEMRFEDVSIAFAAQSTGRNASRFLTLFLTIFSACR